MPIPSVSHRIERRVSHADVDVLGELKLSSLLGLLELAAVEASTAAGFDPARYTRERRVWLIRRTRVERGFPVGGGDRLQIETQVADWRRARSLRRYEVRLLEPGRGLREPDVAPRARGDGGEAGSGDHALVARATTDWVYCDMTTGRPASIPPELQRAFSGSEPLRALDRAEPVRDAGLAPADSEASATPLLVRPSHLDHVTHVNNATYVDFLEDGAFELFAKRGLPLARMLERAGALRFRSLDIEYLVDAMAGDELVVRSRLAEGLASLRDDSSVPLAAPTAEVALVQAIDRSDGVRLVRAASTWGWRRRPSILGGAPEPDRLDGVTRRSLASYVERVAGELGQNLEAIVLFGSAARGERWPAGTGIRSDIDLLVVARAGVPDELRSRLADWTYEPFLESGRQISPHLRTRDDLMAPKDESAAAFARELERDGILLFAAAPGDSLFPHR